jgi:hypothetical protein
MIVSGLILLRIRNVADKIVKKTKHTFHVQLLPPPLKNRVFFEMMWKNIVQPDKPQVTIWRMSIACWIPKATETIAEYVTNIAFPPQQ